MRPCSLALTYLLILLALTGVECEKPSKTKPFKTKPKLHKSACPAGRTMELDSSDSELSAYCCTHALGPDQSASDFLDICQKIKLWPSDSDRLLTSKLFTISASSVAIMLAI